MTIDEAIKQLKDFIHYVDRIYPPDDCNAIKLGIGALRIYKKLKRTNVLPIGYKLPGETKD